MKLKTSVLTFLALLLFSTVSFANVITGKTIYDEIVQHLDGYNLKSEPAINNARLFPSCPSDISIKSVFGSFKTVEISCPNTDWRLVVRTNAKGILNSLQGQAQKEHQAQKFIVVLSTSLNKGDILKIENLTYLESKKAVAGGVFYNQAEVVGRSLKQQLSVGSIVRARHLIPDWIITKDQIVIIEHRVGNIIINAQGVAQEPGQMGQRIWVNNFNTGKKVLCWIENDKKVTTNAKIY